MQRVVNKKVIRMRDRIAGTIPDPEGRSGTGPSTAISETYSILVG